MNKDILLIVDAMSNARDLDKAIIFDAVEQALAAVGAKSFDDDVKLRVAINTQTGDYESFRVWTVVADNAEELDEEFEYNPDQSIRLTEAQQTDSALQVGDTIEEAVESSVSGRIGAQQMRQVMMQKVREAERAKVAAFYENRLGELVMGTVKRVTRDFAFVDLGNNAEAMMPRDQMLPREAFRMNDRIRACLYEVKSERRGPQLLISRAHPNFLIELFKIEVPEIGEEVIEIKAAARDAGARAKIAVKTNDGRIDPIGACVGMRGSRVQAVSNELGGERIDIVLWDDNPAQLVINAMSPAEVASIIVDEESHSMDIAVREDQLSLAIGRSGQNIRLASELSGWTLNVMSEEDAANKHEGESTKIRSLFQEKLGVDETLADVLAQEGFTNLEEIAYVPVEELLNIEGFDENIAEELQQRASDVLLTQEIASQEEIEGAQPAQDLLDVDGMNEKLAKQLASKEIVSREDLAELAVDELEALVQIDTADAAKLIMAARAHWFEDDNE